MPWLVLPRPKGELVIQHRERGVKWVVGPPGSPIIVIYRCGKYMLKLETEHTSESLGSTLAQKSLESEFTSSVIINP